MRLPPPALCNHIPLQPTVGRINFATEGLRARVGRFPVGRRARSGLAVTPVTENSAPINRCTSRGVRRCPPKLLTPLG